MKMGHWLLSLALTASAVAQAEDVKIMHLQMGGSYHNLFVQELMAHPTAQGEKVQAIVLPTPASKGANPFHFTAYNWDFGDVFFQEGKTSLKEVPIASPAELKWFRQARESGKIPDLMIISGHHIPGIGWHSDPTWGEDEFYTRSLMLSSLLRLREENEDARAFFDNVKFVFISGCWGLENMEPHTSEGRLFTEDELDTLYLSGVPGRNQVHGTRKDFYSLEAQRWELTTLYGGDFAAQKKDEVCFGNRCVTYDVKRVLSDDSLLDGSHRYNQPYNIRKLFPKAALVFGFHSPSPFNDVVKKLINTALLRAKKSPVLQSEDRAYAGNLIQSIISQETPQDSKIRLVQAFREAWTTVTWEQNKGQMPGYWGGRPGASITPAFPDLDNDGVFAWPKNYPNPSFAPRCLQYRPDAKPCAN